MTGVVVEVDTAFYEPATFGPTGDPIYSELEGYVTYSVYAEFTNPTDELSAIYSDAVVLGTEPFYIDAPCGCFNPGLGDVLLGGTQNPALIDFFPEVAYDTYWTLGYAVGEQYTGSNPSYSSTNMCAEQEDGGLIFTTNPEAAGDDLRIKFAQVTTCGNFEMHACLQVFPMGINDPYQEWCMEGNDYGPITIQNPCENFANSDATVMVTSDINCFGDLATTEVNVNGAAPITYELFNAADTTLISTQVGNNEFADLPQGDYFVAIMDGNTCRDSTEMFSFVEPLQLEASWELIADNSCGELTSVIGMEFSGGTADYESIAYSTTEYANVFYHLQPNNQFVGVPCWYGNGDWIFEITDANGCSVDTLITVTCTEPPEFYDCAGACVLDTDGDGICDELEIPGCTADIAQNFDPLATDDDGSCIIPGCTIEIACNYDPIATVDDNSCAFYCPGCTIEDACNYDPNAIQDDGSCEFPAFAYGCDGECLQDADGDMVCDELEIYGCTIVPACNYDAEATENDGSCFFGIAPGYDCDGNCIYDSDGDGVCDEFEVAGCQDDTACNFDPAATDANGSCEYPENYYQCDGSCVNDSDYDGVCDELEELGCTSVEACNFSATATDNDGSCEFPDVGYDCQGECLLDTDGDSICDQFEIPGCTDEAACNFALEATDEDGSCEFETCAGCTYEYACNFDPLATIADNTTCEFGTCPGCTDVLACNYNPTVTEDDGSCDFTSCVGCMDLDACNYNSLATTDDGSCEYISCTIPGCTDPEACNFDAEAGYDDGSCLTTDICGVCGGSGIAPGTCDCEGNTPALGFDCDGTCLSDLNENGICDVVELVNLQNEIDSLQSQILGGTYCGPGTIWDDESGECISSNSCPQDLDDDGIIGVDDLLLLLGAYGTACEAPNVAWTCGDPVNYHGYDYATVQIGEQCWFAENLRTGYYRNGDEIPHLNPVEWGETTEGAFVEWNLNEFGRLYNGYSAVDTRQLCPQDWNIPSDDDWISLEIFIGMSEAEANAWGQRGAQGEDLKQTYENLSDWTDNQAAVWTGSNGFGFNGLPSGNVDAGGIPIIWWPGSYYWTSTAAGLPSNNNPASVSRIIDISMAIGRGTYDHIEGMAVRCIKDSE